MKLIFQCKTVVPICVVFCLQPLGDVDQDGEREGGRDVEETPGLPGLQLPVEVRLADRQPPLDGYPNHQVNTRQQADTEGITQDTLTGYW